MKTCNDLRRWAEERRAAGRGFTTLGNLLFQVYRSKLPGDGVQFNVRRALPREEADIKFEEHTETRNFWVFALPKEGVATYEHIHEELSMNDPIEKLKELFPDGRFDYIVDTLLAWDDE